jgi:hypothetical protein
MFLIVGIGLVILVFIAIGSSLANAISKQGLSSISPQEPCE